MGSGSIPLLHRVLGPGSFSFPFSPAPAFTPVLLRLFPRVDRHSHSLSLSLYHTIHKYNKSHHRLLHYTVLQSLPPLISTYIGFLRNLHVRAREQRAERLPNQYIYTIETSTWLYFTEQIDIPVRHIPPNGNGNGSWYWYW
jgi:hypothetical protein